jgi:hypothetical protein
MQHRNHCFPYCCRGVSKLSCLQKVSVRITLKASLLLSERLSIGCGYKKECNLAYEHLECNFRFKNIRLENVHKVQFSKIVPRVLIWSQQDNPNGILVGICRQHCSSIPMWLLEFASPWIAAYILNSIHICLLLIMPDAVSNLVSRPC